MAETGPDKADSTYSRAFESFAPDGNDLIGLLGYALYKAHIREAFLNRQAVNTGSNRAPTQTEIRAFRGEAERRLSVFADSMVEQATPEIERAGVTREVHASRDAIIAEMGRRTSYRTAIATNVIGWLVSIAITVLVALSGIPDWVVRLVSHTGSSR
ncbi:MAG: hypothetical protein K2X49_18395 [Acetobacteraceae bacterium]|nr:hypothetical protein [Acetobacteraceae bacterium]